MGGTLTFSIDCDWVSSLHEEPEVRQTSVGLKITLGAGVLTQNVDDWSKTVSDEVRLSAYPLALWFASNWWRCNELSLKNSSPPLQAGFPAIRGHEFRRGSPPHRDGFRIRWQIQAKK